MNEIVCLHGSPRHHGNSSTLARYFLEAARARGAHCREFVLNDLELRGCQACEACKTTHESCVLNDGLAEVLEAVFHADLVVFASPVYYGDVSAQLKAFIDRTYAYLKPRYITLTHPSRLPERKPLVFILTQGHRDPQAFADVLPRYQELFRWVGFANVHPVRVVDVYHPADVESKTPEAFRMLEALAGELLG